MKVGSLKGALLEYIIRNLLKRCGFSNVKEDNLYSFQRGGLFFVNGKGAAHDADVLMNPPIQMPFTYPTQLLIECKAYGRTAMLTIIRNALGLRNDLNDFEIVTKKSLLKRQNNRRASYAIATRNRFLYQVGVASVNEYSKPAIEFAANNKIPLLSLSWFLSEHIIATFNNIDQPMINSFDSSQIKNLYDFLKDRDAKLIDIKYKDAREILASNNSIAEVLDFADMAINYSYIGLLETGDMVFLYSRTGSQNNILNQSGGLVGLKAEIHWFSNRPNVWTLTVFSEESQQRTDFDFYLPNRIFDHWKKFNLNKSIALDIKGEFFSKIFVFNRRSNPEAPFSIINIDRQWLQSAREGLLLDRPR